LSREVRSIRLSLSVCTVTLSAAEHHRAWAGTKLCCSATEEHRCERFACGRYWNRDGLESYMRVDRISTNFKQKS